MEIRKAILTRFGVMYALTVVFAIYVVARVIIIQGTSDWGEKGQRMEVKEVKIEARRGDICAADGSPLATSVPYYELRMDMDASGLSQVFHKEVDSLAICLSRTLRDRSAGSYKAALMRAFNTKQRYYLVSSKKVSYMELQKIKQFPIFRRGRNKGGLIPEQENNRVYPFGGMAVRTLGKLSKGVLAADGTENAGAFGLEQSFEEELRGRDGQAVKQNMSGRWLIISKEDPNDGYNIVTTLDVKLQDQVMYSLRKMIERTRAEYGTAILMEVKTGDIKAVSNFGRNSSGQLVQGYQNYAVGNAGCSEPGSTFKLVSLMAAIEDGKIDTSTIVDTGNGLWNYKKQWVRDSDHEKGGHGKISAKRAFELSSNVGVAKLITQSYTGHESDFVDKIRDFGFTDIPEIGIKGMGEPYIKSPDDKFWSGVTLAWMSFGYELKITPLQTLMFYNAVANNGKMMKPRLVTSITENGNVVEKFGTKVLDRSICSSSTLHKAQAMLEGVVENGTGTGIKSKAYKIAGKTGTAQVANRKDGYNHKGMKVYQSSFVGYFPADDPKYSCIVVINGPKGGNYYGGSVAGPVFRQIADHVLAYELGMREDFERLEKDEAPEFPGLVAGRKKDIAEVLDECDILDGWAFNKSEWVEANKDDDGLALKSREIKPGILPNVKGMGATDAVYLLENAGLRVSLRGQGKVKSQSLRAGDPVRKGQQIVLILG